MVSMPHGYGKLEKKTEIKPEKAELNMGLSRNRVLAIPVGPYHFPYFNGHIQVYTPFSDMPICTILMENHHF